MLFFWTFLVLLLCFIPRLITVFSRPQIQLISYQDTEINDQMTKRTIGLNAREKVFGESRFKKPTAKFDPNNLSLKGWMDLGLSEKQANIVLKFSKRGLTSNEDLERIYVFPKELLSLIEDWTVYPEKVESQSGQTFEKEFNKPAIKAKLELNVATFEQLVELPGIGDYLAEKIIKYRERLGGFIDMNQLKEIKYVDEEKIKMLEKHIQLFEPITKINLNECTWEQLKNHPYLNYSLANSILKLRNQKGKYNTIDEIKESALMTEEIFQKLKPYLSL